MDLLDILIPKGYTILEPPENYVQVRGANRSNHPPAPTSYSIPKNNITDLETSVDVPDEQLLFFAPHDRTLFNSLLRNQNDEVLRTLLRVKNGIPSVRRLAMRSLAATAKQIGPEPLLTHLICILKVESLQDFERHLMVKSVARVVSALKDQAAPYTHSLLVVLQPLLVANDNYIKRDGRETMAVLARSVGLPCMLNALKQDADDPSDYVRQVTAISLAVCAQTHTLGKIVPFLLWASEQAPQLAARAVLHISKSMGSGVLSYLPQLLRCVSGFSGPSQLVFARVGACAALADAAAPFGIECFDPLIPELWQCARRHRGAGLAPFLRALAALVPLMDPEAAPAFVGQVLELACKHFGSNEEAARRAALYAVSRCARADPSALDQATLKTTVIPAFVSHFWVRRVALNSGLAKQVIQATNELAECTSPAPLLEGIIELRVLLDPSRDLVKMGFEAVANLAAAIAREKYMVELNPRKEEQVMDTLITALKMAPTTLDKTLVQGVGQLARVMLFARSNVVLLDELVSCLLGLLNDPSPGRRETSALVIAEIAMGLARARSNALLQLGSVLYEHLGEDYPSTLAALLKALGAIVKVVGLARMQPPVSDILPRLNPILRNRNERVQEECLVVVGGIADRGPEYVSAREWMRICFELVDLLKAPRRSVRKAANDTFGYIARGIGPQDVLALLLENLKVQERQVRVCAAVALGIVADTCEPFTVLPALMNEYRAPDLNVQHGVLKGLAFMFQYIGSSANDYLYAASTVISHALQERNSISRQTAASIVYHLGLSCRGLGHQDVMLHFLNLVLPNIFETAPHFIQRVLQALESLCAALGGPLLMAHVWAGLFHPARVVRSVYWEMHNIALMQCGDALVGAYPVDVPAMDVWF